MKNVLQKLIEIANKLDGNGHHKIANKIDDLLKQASDLSPEEYEKYYGKPMDTERLHRWQNQQGKKDVPKKSEMMIKNWGLVYYSNDPFTAPENRGFAIGGEIYGNPKFVDGYKVKTSKVTHIEQLPDGNFIAYTERSTYRLEEPNPEFLKMLETKGKTLKDVLDI